ncbi:MAG TPA: TIGR02281 family clan AA aspartic protease [Caulobacteraceae bacterium]|nr:TIGR02281 family clan AA aspartic protease [Caulobacteraceae bacterium]
MGDFDGPWGAPRPAPPQKRRLVLAAQRGVRVGVLLWLGLMTVAGVAFLLFARFFPGRLSGLDKGEALRDFALLALVSSGLLAASRIDLGRGLRHLSIWILIVAVLFAGYAFKDDLAGAALKARLALIPEAPARGADGSIALSRSDDGGFYVIGQANGVPMRFLIDTGASDIVLAPEDAQRLGIDLAALHFVRPGETANGVAFAAPYTLSSLQVGPVKLYNVPVTVNRAPMSASLLGTPFLRRLASFEIRGDRVILKPAPAH